MVGAAVFGVAFAFYAVMAAPALGWLDSPEFTAAAASLGIPHSPGHPLAPLLAFAGTWVPIGDIAFRVALVSAAAGAASVWLVYRCAAEILAARDVNGPPAQAIAVAAAAVFGLSPALVAQATRAEVYSLATALALAVVLATIRFARGDRRAIVWGALAGGLAFATHNVIATTAVIPAFAIACHSMLRRETPARLLVPALAAFGSGLLVLAYLPARASAFPVVNWGVPSTLERFWWVISGKAFHKTAALAPVSSPGEEFAEITAAIAHSAGLVVTLTAIVGVYVALRVASLRRIGVACVLTFALAIFARWILGFDPETPDHHAYLLPAIAAAVLLAVCAAAELARHGRRGSTAALAVLAGGAALQLTQVSNASLRTAFSGDDMARIDIATLPPRAVVITSYFQTTFRRWAMTAVENARPDVEWLDRSFLTYPGFDEAARRRAPDLRALIDAPLSANSKTPTAQLDSLAKQRPVFMELHINLDDEARARLAPQGPWAAYGRSATSSPEYVTTLDRIAAEAVPADTSEVTGAVLWQSLVRIDFFCRTAQPERARPWLDRADTLAPGDRTLADLRRACLP